MLTEAQLQALRDYALGGGLGDGEGHPLTPLEETLEMMRTPITAESLKAAGWIERYDNWFECRPRVAVFWPDGWDWPRVKIGGVFAHNVRTMHDLAELVRLLSKPGGE